MILAEFCICAGGTFGGTGLPLALVLAFLVYMYYDSSSLVIALYTR